MYWVTGPRQDLAYTILYLKELFSCPIEEHIKATQHLFSYINSSWNLGLFYLIFVTGWGGAGFHP